MLEHSEEPTVARRDQWFLEERHIGRVEKEGLQGNNRKLSEVMAVFVLIEYRYTFFTYTYVKIYPVMRKMETPLELFKIEHTGSHSNFLIYDKF